ncbi:hypothetical protein U1Q18_014469 [Sarracenia purpurea var. burkii]
MGCWKSAELGIIHLAGEEEALSRALCVWVWLMVLWKSAGLTFIGKLNLILLGHHAPLMLSELWDMFTYDKWLDAFQLDFCRLFAFLFRRASLVQGSHGLGDFHLEFLRGPMGPNFVNSAAKWAVFWRARLYSVFAILTGSPPVS